MVLLPVYDLGLPPLGALVLFSLHYWILTRIRRKKLLKVTKSSSFLGGSINDKEATMNDIVIAQNSDKSTLDLLKLPEQEVSEQWSCFEREIMMKNASFSCTSTSLINGKELTDAKCVTEEGVEFARNNKNLSDNDGAVTQNGEMHQQVHCNLTSFGKEWLCDLLHKGLSGVHESDIGSESTPPVTDLNLEYLKSDCTNMPQSPARTPPACINDDAEVLQIVHEADSILSEKQSYMDLSNIVKENEMFVGHKQNVGSDGGVSKKLESTNDREVSIVDAIKVVADLEDCQQAQSEMSRDLAKDSSVIFDHEAYKSFAGDFIAGDETGGECDARAKDAEENEDVSSRLSGGTNETSEDSGVDNVESDQKIPNREQTLSKSESEDCDSYVSSTLVSASENDVINTFKDVIELEEVLGSAAKDESENAGIQMEICTEEVETIIENQFMESYTSFLFPQNLSGLLIGKNGSFVKALNRETGALLSVLPYNDHLVTVMLVALSCDEVLNGLTSLREKFSNCIDVDFDTVLEESFDVTSRKKLIGEDYLTKYTHVSYKFAFPADLVGMLIGRNGSAINEVSTTAGVEINVDDANDEHHIITIIGLPDRIESARQMIKDNFPSEEFPQVDLEEPLPQTPFRRVKINKSMWMMPSESLELVKVTSVVSPNHFFVQRVMMPSYERLKSFCLSLNRSYACCRKDQLPQPIRMNTLCVVELNGSFYRGITIDCRRNDCTILFADFGGQKVYNNSDIYMIRSEFMYYTFQAVECFLDGVQPLGAVKFSPDSMKYMQKQMGNKELLMKAIYRDHVGRSHVEIFIRNEEGNEVNLAEKAASANVVSYTPSYQQ